MIVTTIIIWNVINVSDGQMKNMRACETDVERREQQSLHLLATSSSSGLQRITGLYSQLLLGCFQSVSNASRETKASSLSARNRQGTFEGFVKCSEIID